MPSETMHQDVDATPHGVAASLKEALRRMPSTVALVTTYDISTGELAGLAASALIPVSMEPPSMLVAVNRSASAHAVIERARVFCINLLGTAQTEFVDLFSKSSMRSQRFATAGWGRWNGLPFLLDAPANIFCEVSTTLLFGTHEVFVGEVRHVTCIATAQPLGWLEGDFARLSRLDEIRCDTGS